MIATLLDQQIFNIMIAIIGAIGGWCFKAVWGALKELQQENKQITDKVSKVEILIAGNYASKADLAAALNQILNKLESFENKIDKKEDRKMPYP